MRDLAALIDCSWWGNSSRLVSQEDREELKSLVDCCLMALVDCCLWRNSASLIHQEDKGGFEVSGQILLSMVFGLEKREKGFCCRS